MPATAAAAARVPLGLGDAQSPRTPPPPLFPSLLPSSSSSLPPQEQRASVKSLAEHCTTQLEATSQMNAANDCFYIWHAGPFGTINGFRLGRLPVETVEWHEINAALGQVALLLETIENETPLQLSLTLLPLGSYSQVRSTVLSSRNLVFIIYCRTMAQLHVRRHRSITVPTRRATSTFDPRLHSTSTPLHLCCFRSRFRIARAKVTGLAVYDHTTIAPQLLPITSRDSF